MANAIVRHDALSDDQIDLIKRTIAVGATDNELKLFLYQCERTGLDPLAKQIYSIKRAGKMVTQIGIDGARLIAQRTGRYAGQDGPYWCDSDGVWKDVWISDKNPLAAKVNVYLLGVDRGTPGVAHWKEYAVSNSDLWRKMPALMLAKCAEMLALRKAFPLELSGLYTQEEMAQADTVVEVTGRRIEPTTGEIIDTPTTPVSNPVDGDVLFETPQKPLATPLQLRQFDELGKAYYGDEWPEPAKKLIEGASKGEVSQAALLMENEMKVILVGLQKRINERQPVTA